MSVRPDLLGPEYLRQLQLLQDQVPAFSSADALRMVEAALPPSMSAKDVFK
jgi:predicted unusual protein kinase regulating ubiquinone biosynthesis (AarF/ABC1/UbiB family)